jgi:hypothetical protein
MYTQEISRETPACFLFLLDQSFSMEEPLGGQDARKCDQLANVVNGWLQNMIIKASGGSGVKDWMEVGVIGYRTDEEGNTLITSALSDPLDQQALVQISEFNEHPLRIDDKVQKMFDEETGEEMEFPVQIPVWVDPVAEGGTPMCTVLHYAYEVLSAWIAEHPSSFPPILIHITDGESQDGDPIPYANPIKELQTEDGNVLFFNCHLSMQAADPFVFPHSNEVLPEELARVLFEMSSVLPEAMFERARAEGFEVQPGARGMVYNADMISLLQFLDMGTRVAKNLR